MRNISVIGFGKIGQAIAANILENDCRVTAIDTDAGLAEQFKDGNYSTNEPGLGTILNEAYAQEKLLITGDFSFVKDTDAVIVAVPLLVDDKKELLKRPFLEAFESFAAFLSGKMPVVIETTLPVGFSRGDVLPAIEKTGKKHGIDFLLAHSPERIKSGTMMEQLRQIPKVIGGLNAEATEKTTAIYESFFDSKQLYIVESIEAAEMVKLAGMIYRDVNIALSNQLARFANTRRIHFADLIALINTDREAGLLFPGIGVGGHCTPVYPYFLIENFKQAGLDFSLAAESRKINDQMADYAVSLISDRVQNKTALILGLGFRPNVKEDSLSTAYLLRDALFQSGFSVALHDAEFSEKEIRSKGFEPAPDMYASGAEVVFLVTMHREYSELDFRKLYAGGSRYFVDGRNSIDKASVEEAGIRYFGIGR